MMQRLTIIVFLLVCSAIPGSTFAATVQTASELIIPEVQIIHGNTYLAGGKVTMNGVIMGDTTIVASETSLAGTVEDDVLVFGGTVSVTGHVQGDLRVVGGTSTIAGRIDGDVVVVGGTIRIEENAQFTGDIILVGGSVFIDSPIQKHARVIAGTTVLANSLSGTANITTRKLTVADDANISGSVVYFAPMEAYITSKAVVNGSVQFNNIKEMSQVGVIDRAVVNFLHFWTVLRFVTTLLLTFLLVYMFKVFSQKTTEYIARSFGATILSGLGVMILTPIIGIIIALSLILLPIAMLVGLFYLIMLILAPAIAGIAIGALMKKAFSKTAVLEVSFHTAALGVVLLTLIRFVPIVGDATHLIFFVAALGAMWRYMYAHVRHRELQVFQKTN